MENRELNNILVIEDEEDIRKIVRVALEHGGNYTVELCSSAPEALDHLNSNQPDLILLDVMMPVMDGPTFLTELKNSETTKSIPVILMTAKVQSHELEQYKELGVLGVISKPFDPVSLPQDIENMWQTMNTEIISPD